MIKIQIFRNYKRKVEILNDLINYKLEHDSFFVDEEEHQKEVIKILRTYKNGKLRKIFSILKKLFNFQAVTIPYKYEDIIKTIIELWYYDFIKKIMEDLENLPSRCFDKKVVELERELNELKID